MSTHPPLREGGAEAVVDLLPDGWSVPEGPQLDLDADPAPAEGPALPRSESGAFALVSARQALPRAGAEWAEWALELARLLMPGGIAVLGLAGPDEYEQLTGERWDEETTGISVVPTAADGRRAFHSGWWLRAHLGRAFEVSGPHADAGGRRTVLLRPLSERPGADGLRAPEPGEPRELAAAQAEVERLLARAERSEARHRRELDALREELGRELMRKAFQATAHGAGWTGDPMFAAVAAQYESTRSWKITKPLRKAGQIARRFR